MTPKTEKHPKVQYAAEPEKPSFKSTDRQLGCCLQMAALQDQGAQHEMKREVTPGRDLVDEVGGQLQE